MKKKIKIFSSIKLSQVASHAIKYFLYGKTKKKEIKRTSNHDTTLHDIAMIVTPHIDQHN